MALGKEFTLMEYVAEHDLRVGQRDSKGQRMVAEHLRTLGYERRRVRLAGAGKAQFVWVKSNRELELKLLAEKLKQLQFKEKHP